MTMDLVYQELIKNGIKLVQKLIWLLVMKFPNTADLHLVYLQNNCFEFNYPSSLINII